jgi:protein CpxP
MTTTATTNETTSTTRGPRRGRWMLLAIPAILGAGIFAMRAQAEAGGFGFGPGMGGSPDMHRAFMARRLDKALDAVQATESQRTAIKAIFARMASEMQPIHQQHRQLHDALASALGAETVDRAAVEKLRVQAAALFDQGSQVFSRAILDAAQVLSSDQRQVLVKHFQERHGRRHGPF